MTINIDISTDLNVFGVNRKTQFGFGSQSKTSCYNKHSLPNWVCDYLEECADQLRSPSAYIGDFARKLPRMLGFNLRMLRNEQFAMKFAKHILNGKNRARRFQPRSQTIAFRDCISGKAKNKQPKDQPKIRAACLSLMERQQPN